LFSLAKTYSPPLPLQWQKMAKYTRLYQCLMKTWLGGLPVGKLGDLPAMFSSKSCRGEFICFLFVLIGLIGVNALPLFLYIFLVFQKLSYDSETKA
jgi:hypothetical protein